MKPRRQPDPFMLGGLPEEEDPVAGMDTLAYEPEPGAVDTNAVRPMLDDYLNDAPLAPVQNQTFTPPDDDDAWVGEMASRLDLNPTQPKRALQQDTSGSEQRARAESARIMGSGTNGWNLAAAFLDPGGEPARQRTRKEMAEQPMKEFQESQRNGQARRSNDMNEAYRRDALAAREEAALRSHLDRDRGLDIRDRGLDIREDTSLTPEQRAQLQRSAADERIRVNVANESGKNRRTAMLSGRRDLMEAEGALPPGSPGATPTNMPEAIADQVRQRFAAEGIEVTPEMERDILTIATSKGSDTQRRQNIDQMVDRLKEERDRRSGSAANIEDRRRQENIPQVKAEINAARSRLLASRQPGEEDAPGLKWYQRAAGAVSPAARDLLSGPEGRAVVADLTSLRDMLEKMQTGMRASGVENTRYDSILALNWYQNTDEVLDALERLDQRLIDRDAEIIAGHGVQGGQTMADRREPAMQVAPTLQPRRVDPSTVRRLP